MALRKLSLAPILETSTSDVLRNFVIPCLSESNRFDRGVGYFTSNWLRLAATGLTSLAGRGGHVRLIASPKLEADDWAALAQGVNAIHDPRVYAALLRTVNELTQDLESEPPRALAWMIADGLLDIRLALPANALDGDFHDKFGIFYDDSDNRVAFHGSMNDSAQAFRNYEGLDVFTSWGSEPDAVRVGAHEARFNRLWNNSDVNVRVYELPEAIRRNLVEFTSRTERPYPEPRLAAVWNAQLWRHQDDAVAAFLRERAGILEMATGTGKTRTAIRILNELQERGQIDLVIICAGGPDLLDQWRNQLAINTSMPLYCTYGGAHDEIGFLTQTRDAIWIASRDALIDLLTRMPPARRARTLLICDEVHGLGAPAVVAALTGVVRTFGFRLGLSATPEREYDADGNIFIEQEIGPVIYRFGLDEAIRRGILCEFEYIPLPYIFLDDDKKKVRDAVAAYHARVKAGERVPLEWLWLTISRVSKEAPNKIPVFRAYLRAHPEVLRRTLIFVETMAFGEMVQPVLMEHTRDFHTYYGSDDQIHLQRFARGDLTVLLTAHRISEGIDIQAVDTIVLFSAARARLETIQRLGRCLRTDPSNPTKRAIVVDFVRADIEPDDKTDQLHADQERTEWLSALAAIRHDPTP
jgi:superfamily II DNA or RNA helicase